MTSWQPSDGDDLSASLLSAFQSRFGISSPNQPTTAVPTNTKVLDSAQYVADQAIDVFINRDGLYSAASSITQSIKTKPFTTAAWREHELHPNPTESRMNEDEIIRFIFTMDLLNFSFWSDDESRPFELEYKGRMWTGYWSLVAGLWRALDEGIEITNPHFWARRECNLALLRYVFAGGKSVERRKPPWTERSDEPGDGNSIRDSATQNIDIDASTETNSGDVEMGEPERAHDGTNEGDAVPSETVSEDPILDSNEAVLSNDDGSQEAVELPIHDAPTVEKQAESGFMEPRMSDENTLGGETEVGDEDSDDETIVDEEPGSAMPLLKERLQCLKEAAQVLKEQYEGNPLNLIKAADKSAGRLVNILVRDFSCFNDKHDYEGYKIRFYKRAQILVADLWACFQGQTASPGEFQDIDCLTAFADYRIPQMLHTMGVLSYSPPLDARVRRKELLESGGSWEVQLRGCSVWAVELLRREVCAEVSSGSDSSMADVPKNGREPINAILLDFHLYDNMKALEEEAKNAVSEGKAEGKMLTNEIVPHHRTRSIWY